MVDWPHSPVHRLSDAGAYMVTAGTHNKKPLINTPSKLSFVRDTLFDLCESYGLQLQAWAILANHYHFITLCPAESNALKETVRKLHSITARKINRVEGTSGRRVWFQFWDSHITFEKSYFARLNYVHQNPVHHGVVRTADQYRWCSARWFMTNSEKAFVKTVMSFKTDKIKVNDDF